MPVARRVSRRYLDQQTARRIVGRVFWAMSRDEAKRTLKLPLGVEPSDEDIGKAYKALVRDAIRNDPEAAITQEALKDFNVAKDTLRGQFDRKAPGTGPNAPESGGRAPTNFRPEPPPSDPPPMPKGDSFTVAFHTLGNVEWKIATDGVYNEEVVVEDEGPPRKIYWTLIEEVILIGKTDTHYVFAKLTQRTNSRKDYRDKTIYSRWESFKFVRPVADHNLLKLAPKVLKGMREGAHRRAQFTVLEGALTEQRLLNLRGRLSLPDAIIGSGILAEGAPTPKGRKIQVELEPVFNQAKYTAMSRMSEGHNAYDWFLYVNGKQHQLADHEVEGLKTTYLLSSVFGYDYRKGRVNLTRLKGTRMKMGPKASLDALAKSLDAGPVRDAVERASEAFPEEG
jgi:hypothetical protein